VNDIACAEGQRAVGRLEHQASVLVEIEGPTLDRPVSWKLDPHVAIQGRAAAAVLVQEGLR
jgi:hypothetical protein